MSLPKKIVKKIGEGTLEIIKDSAKQVVDTVSPEALLRAATNQPPKSELGDYLKGLGNGLEGEALKKKQEESHSDDEKKKRELRRILTGIPAHMQLPAKQQELRPYEKAMKEEEEKAQQIEAQKQQKQFVVPTSKASRGGLFAKKKRPDSANMELNKNIKSG